ncbi:MAG: 1-acyl-sn-glycerol-3-phosphate acyltransferase [Cyanobacteria bacterium P01_A01_bin.123]
MNSPIPSPMSNTTPTQLTQALNDNQTQGTTTLTPEVLQRVREGIAAGRSELVRWSVREAFEQFERLRAGKRDRRVSGRLRQKVLRGLTHSLFQIRVEQAENIPNMPCIVTANHLSHIDPFILLGELSAPPFYYIMGDARTLYNNWWKRWVLNWAGGLIPLNRWWKEELAVIEAAQTEVNSELQALATAIEQSVPSGGDLKTTRQLDRAVQAIFDGGDSLMLFPEGRLGAQEGHLHLPLKRGTVLYALRGGVPIVPVSIVGTQDLHWRKPINLKFGKPLYCEPMPRPTKQAIDQMLKRLTEALLDLLPPCYEEPKGAKPLRHTLNHLFW